MMKKYNNGICRSVMTAACFFRNKYKEKINNARDSEFKDATKAVGARSI